MDQRSRISLPHNVHLFEEFVQSFWPLIAAINPGFRFTAFRTLGEFCTVRYRKNHKRLSVYFEWKQVKVGCRWHGEGKVVEDHAGRESQRGEHVYIRTRSVSIIGVLRIKANGTSKSTHTSIGSRIGTDVPQSNDIFGLKSCSKAQEPRSLYLADRKQQCP